MSQPPAPIEAREYDGLPVRIYRSADDLGAAAAGDGAAAILEAIAARGEANVVMATGNSQLAYYAALRQDERIDWSKVRVFLVDQYLGVDEDTFGTLVFMRKHLLAYVKPLEVHPFPASEAGIEDVAKDLEALLRRYPSDLTSLGFGENGHLAFNDPHNADFDDPVWVKKVTLSEESRRQPVSEGRFPSIDHVPKYAITMTIPALLAARKILCIVPEGRKAPAVRACLEDPIATARPGSVLRRTSNTVVYLDTDSAAALRRD